MATTHSKKCQQTFSWVGGESTKPHAQPTPRREINQGQDRNKKRTGGEKDRTQQSTIPYTHQTQRHIHQGTRYQRHNVQWSKCQFSTYIQLRKPIPDDSLPRWQQLHMGGTYEKSNGGRDDTSAIMSSHKNEKMWNHTNQTSSQQWSISSLQICHLWVQNYVPTGTTKWA